MIILRTSKDCFLYINKSANKEYGGFTLEGIDHNGNPLEVCTNGEHDLLMFPIKIESIEHVFGVLHEIGHAYYQHCASGGKISLQDVYREVQAWVYASKCIKPKYLDTFIHFAWRSIGTYNVEAEINYGEWITFAEFKRYIEEKI